MILAVKSSSQHELKKYLNKIRRDFDIDAILNGKIDTSEIIDYYDQSDFGYRLFHSTEGSVHMALSFDHVFDESGYYGQAEIVKKHIDEIHAETVLELASGKGFNLIYLGQANKKVQFYGIDLNPRYVDIACRRSTGLTNLKFSVANFEALPFPGAMFDVVFEVESLCHAENMAHALSEAYRVLRPGGRLIVFDGFRKPEFTALDENVQLAARLVERSMAIERGRVIDEWLDQARSVGLAVLSVEDLSHAIMPNLLKFQFLARGYFKFPKLNCIIRRVTPTHFVRNAIAGVLMPFTLRAGAQGYFLAVLQRPASL